jgi:type VI secretion system secreted protein VgrG
MPLTQENRLIAVDTPLGKDVLLLLGFKGREEVSDPFHFELDCISENHNISFESIVGKNATVSIILADGSKRFFNGIVASFSQGRGGAEAGSDPRFSYYSAVLVPWLWLLTKYADVKIFQELSTPDIIEKVFTDRGFSDFKLQLQGSYEKRTYCVQYRETDFNFVSRLMEEEGIYYYFEHEQGKHTLVLANSPSGHKPCQKQDSARYQISAGGHEEEDVITALDRSKAIRCGKYALNDYNYLMPNTDLRSNVTSRQMLGQGKREIYDYPGLYPNKGRGDHLTTVRMEEEEAQITILTGASVCRAFGTGYRFTLQDHYRQDMNHKPYVLTQIQHEAYQGADYPGVAPEAGGEEFTYSNSFECIPYEVPYRPRQRAEKPRVHGTQTAVVVGPSGEEIYTDDLGRIKVQFHWDREGKKDENSSCWIRVGQVWAGPQWGAVYLPRIGQEVIVDFLEGDPDRPLVIGCVYHKAHMPPLNLPGEKTRSTIKSDSTIGGGGFNEIRFEDKKGQEEIYTHAQRNMTQEVENDKSIQVGRDEKHDVKRDHTVAITNNDSKKVTGRQEIQITGPVSITWSAGATMTIGGLGLTISVGGPVSIKAPIITLDSPTVRVSGVLQCGILNASVSVSSPSYTPGVGNLI